MSDQRIYAVTVGRLSDGQRVVEVMEFSTEKEDTMWSDDINSAHEGLFCGVHYREDMERYVNSLLG
mgnify:CR=1 FL=1